MVSQPGPAVHDADKSSPEHAERRLRRRAANDELRVQLIRRLHDEGGLDVAAPLENCQQDFGLTCTSCGHAHTVKTNCRCRWCPVCQPLVTAERVARWNAAIDLLEWPLFITLTIPNSEDPASLLVLKKHWSALRRQKIWTEKVKGGVGTFEITNKGNGWHPHVHAIVDCQWLSRDVPEPQRWHSAEHKKELCRRAQEEFTSLWSKRLGITWSSVWIQRVHSNTIRGEVLKYAVKGSELLECEEPITPMLRVLKKTRSLSGFGSLFPMPSPDDEQKPSCSCPDCGDVKSFIPTELAIRYGVDARELISGRTVRPSNQNKK